jgi:hypothetical protein
VSDPTWGSLGKFRRTENSISTGNSDVQMSDILATALTSTVETSETETTDISNKVSLILVHFGVPSQIMDRTLDIVLNVCIEESVD